MANDQTLTERAANTARVLRPLGTKPMSREQATRAAQLLGLHWASVYRLRRRFLADPVASSLSPRSRGPKVGNRRLDDGVEEPWRRKPYGMPLAAGWTQILQTSGTRR